MADVAIVTYGSFGDFGGLLYKDKQEVLFPLGHPAHNETGVNDGVPTFQGIEWTLSDASWYRSIACEDKRNASVTSTTYSLDIELLLWQNTFCQIYYMQS